MEPGSPCFHRRMLKTAYKSRIHNSVTKVNTNLAPMLPQSTDSIETKIFFYYYNDIVFLKNQKYYYELFL